MPQKSKTTQILEHLCPNYSKLDGAELGRAALYGAAGGAYKAYKAIPGRLARGAAAGAAVGAAGGVVVGGVGAVPVAVVGAAQGATDAVIFGSAKDILGSALFGAGGNLLSQCRRK